MRFEQKSVVITGGARGIGASIARAFAKEGARVAVCDIDHESALLTAQQLPSARAWKLDVRSSENWSQVIREIIADFGGFDILINNAGVIVTESIADQTEASLSFLADVNTKGVQLGLQAAFRAMRPGGPAGRGGAIVNLSSTAAYMSAPGFSAYCASKAAVERLTKVAANEAGRAGYGIRINCIYPGNIDTDMMMKLINDQVRLGILSSVDESRAFLANACALGRLGHPDDVATACLFLCSDDAAYITGAGLAVDGGTGLI